MQSILKGIAVTIFQIISINLLAQQELDPVTITTSLQPISSSSTGRNILVIKGEQFAKLPVNSIDELLRYLPGIEVQMRGPMGAQSDIVVRGGTFQQVLVIVDGIRVNDPNTGHFNSYIPIAPSEISRIEILKGASSAIYGAEAVGGVIHVITKSFDAKKDASSKNLSALTSVGEYGLVNVQAGGFYTNNGTSISGGVLTNNASGQPQRGINGFFHNTTASISAKQFITNAWSIAYRGAYDKRDFAAQNFYTTFASDTSREKVTSYWNHVRLAFAKDKHSFTLDAGQKNVDDQFQYNPISTTNSNKSRLLQGLAVYNWKASEKTGLTAGTQFVNKKINSNDRGNHNLDQAGAFMILNQKFGDHVYVNPALRLDWNERTGWEVVPQLNLSYRVKDLQLRGSAGKTIRDADFTERFNNYNKPLVTGGSLGNPDLEPERSFSYEAGADFFGIKDIKIATTYFVRDHAQLIDYVPTPYAEIPRKSNLVPTGKYALAKNLGEVKTHGFEVDVQMIKNLNHDQHIWATLGATILNSKSNSGTPSFYLSSHAKFLLNSSINYTVKWFSISANAIYKERKPQTATAINAVISDNYFVANVRLQAMVCKMVGAFVQVDNIFDKKYSDLLGSQMPGRWLMGGLKVTL